MATFKQLLEAQTKAVEKILGFIKSETGEILAQLEKGKEQAANAATEAAFSEAIESLGSFTATIGDAVAGMVPGVVTPDVPTEPVVVDAPADSASTVSVESVTVIEVVQAAESTEAQAAVAVEVPVVISEVSTGVDGAPAVDLAVEVATPAEVVSVESSAA